MKRENLFINRVMEHIWSDESRIFNEIYKIGMLLPVNKLYGLLKDSKATFFTYKDSYMNNLVTCGCQHHIHNGNISGCSMCNLQKQSISQLALMTALRDKNSNLYSDVVVNSFNHARGKLNSRTIHEYLFSYDFLNTKEIPDICLEKLLGVNGIYKRKPLVYEFETTANSITWERLKLIKNYTGNSKVIIRIGVECEDEKIRNCWLNKNTTNCKIVSAINLCREMGIQVTGNILFGIPGFTEELSIKQFVDTVIWLNDLSINTISCSILGRPEKSLQGYLYNHLRDNIRLVKAGVASGDHTGLPWFFSFLKALCECENKLGSISEKVVFGQFNPSYIERSQENAYNQNRKCGCNKEMKNILSKGKIGESDKMKELLKLSSSDPCYQSYRYFVQKQRVIKDYKQNMKVIAAEIAECIWEKSDFYYNLFSEEIDNY